MDIFILAKIVTTLVALGGGMYTIWIKAIRPLIQWFKKFAGLLETMEKEFKPNGGSSMRDAINRIELRQIIADQRSKALDMDSIKGVWEADAEGKCIHTNRTWQKITGLSQDAAEGHGWINAVHPDDREGVTKEWEKAISQQREFYMTFRVNTGKKQKRVISVGYPLKSADGKTHRYAGILVEESEEDTVFFDNDRV